jgi:hypothetical protein
MDRVALGCLEGERFERSTGLHWDVKRENGLRDGHDYIGVFIGRMD